LSQTAKHYYRHHNLTLLLMLNRTHFMFSKYNNSPVPNMSTFTNPTQKFPERALALQKYLLLHSKYDAVQRHLSQITASARSSATSSPDRSIYGRLSHSSSTRSTSFSSTDSLSCHSLPVRNVITWPQSNSLPVVIAEATYTEIEAYEIRLRGVNLQIKDTLEVLLNCETVRCDRRYYEWVKMRLGNAERELEGIGDKCNGWSGRVLGG